MSEDENPNTPRERSKNTPIQNLGYAWAGATLGCLGGVVYLLIVVLLAIFTKLTANKLVFDILALVGPIPVLYYAKKNNKVYLFWGFIAPYMLVMLLYGQCFFTGHW